MKKVRRSDKVQTQESGIVQAAKIYRYCAYQERSHREVKNKLFEYGLRPGEVDEIMAHLITEGFLNEERYAKAFAGGKFRMMKWGRLKIKHQLEFEGVSARNITRGLAEISDADYAKTLRQLIKKRSVSSTEKDIFRKKNQLARFVIGKGFEPELVWEAVSDFLT